MKHPREFPSSAYSALADVAPPGTYVRFDSLRDVPSALSRVGGFPSSDDFRTTVLMASGTSESPPTVGRITPAPGTPIYRVSAVRLHRHEPDGEAHFNKDDVLVFSDRSGQVWQLYSRDEAQHYEPLSIDSGLSAAIDIYSWPAAPAGPLSAIQEVGGLVDFTTGKPK